MKKILLFLMAALLCLLTATAQPTAGLMAYWRMDGNYLDAGPNLINGTNAGSTATTNNKSLANMAMAYSNPAAPVVQFATHPVNTNVSFGINQDFSIDFSILTSSQPHPGGIYDNNLNYGGPGVFMWNANGFQQINFNFKNGNIGSTNGALPLNFWKHVCCVRAGTAIKIYVNGVLNATGTPSTTAPVYSFPARFGTMFFNGFAPPEYNGHNGKIDEFRIYNRALTAIEILQLSSVALPIKLTSFTAANNNNNIKLQWQTQYEQNSKHFIIQRSTDGINFTDIDKVTAAGNSNVSLTYNYIDVLPAMLQYAPTVFYRIQAVDIDGQFLNSEIAAVHLNKKDIQLLVFPNPVKDVLQVQTNGLTGQATLSITDAAGRQVYIRDILLEQGSNSIPIKIAQFNSGVYYVRLSNGKDSFTKQFVKE
jgi:Concanavalin A-like lectin/glucanases superfamily/Secretion system C-terminal sorting domain